VGKAVSDRNGVETMWVDEPGSAKNTLNAKWVETLQTDSDRFGATLQFADKVEVETVTLDELIAAYGRPFYIKIDVEGYEPAVLRGLHTAVRCISFEVNLPEFMPEALECVHLLEKIAGGGAFNFLVDCRDGFGARPWNRLESFVVDLEACREPSIEVFWRPPQDA
jgi:hypothetical protein